MKEVRDEVIDIIIGYVSDVSEWDYSYRHAGFYQKTYSLWAAEEILQLVYENEKDPECLVEEFMRQMDKFSTMSKNDNRFSIARDAAECILDRIIMWRYSNIVNG